MKYPLIMCVIKSVFIDALFYRLKIRRFRNYIDALYIYLYRLFKFWLL